MEVVDDGEEGQLGAEVSTSGFGVGWVGSAGGTLSGAQRVARMRGEPEPTEVKGRKGSGRAATVRSYTVTVTRLADGQAMSETIGPAYWSKTRWQQERDAAVARLKRALGGTP